MLCVVWSVFCGGEGPKKMIFHDVEVLIHVYCVIGIVCDGKVSRSALFSVFVIYLVHKIQFLRPSKDIQ